MVYAVKNFFCLFCQSLLERIVGGVPVRLDIFTKLIMSALAEPIFSVSEQRLFITDIDLDFAWHPNLEVKR